MEVDFNNVRIQACQSFNKMVERLNNNIDENGQILVPATSLSNCIDELRSCLVTIACSYQDGDETVRSVFDDVTPIQFYNPNNR